MSEQLNKDTLYEMLLTQLSTGLLEQAKSSLKDTSKSFVFLDTQTLHLCLLYFLMKQEKQQPSTTTPAQTEKLEQSISQMIAENHVAFSALLDEIKN